MTERPCENCAAPSRELLPVRRVYVVPESWDTPGSHTICDEVELWCFSCTTHYPFEPVQG